MLRIGASSGAQVLRTIAGIPSGPLDLEVSSWRTVWRTFRVENLMGEIYLKTSLEYAQSQVHSILKGIRVFSRGVNFYDVVSSCCPNRVFLNSLSRATFAPITSLL